MFPGKYKLRFLLLIIISGILLLACSFLVVKSIPISINSTSSLKNKKWIEDIEYLQDNLPKCHMNLYHSISKQVFNNEINTLKKDVPNLSDNEIKCSLAQIVASIGDAHTSLNLEFNKNNYIYPLVLWWFGNDLRVVTIDKSHEDILGLKLIKINNISIEKIINRVNLLISHENNQWLKATNVKYITFPDVLNFLKITKGSKVKFTFKDDKNKVVEALLSPELLTPLNMIRVIDKMPVKPLRLQYDPFNLQQSIYWYKYISKSRTLYFQYNQCLDKAVAIRYGWRNGMSYPVFSEFTDKLLNVIKDNNIDKLVVDLRFNSGGDSSLMTNLVHQLGSEDKLRGKGKIFVMVGRETYSSAVLNSLDFKRETNAVFYGEETGGNVNSYGYIKELILPNSKLQISYSTTYYKLSERYNEGFIPDFIINQSYEHYKQGIDDVYEAIKNYEN